jgi:hypothetical protein
LAKSEIDVTRALLASILAGNAYLGAMWLDNELSSHPFNDLKLTGQILTTKSPAWEIMGVANHFSFAVVVSMIYARWAYSRLPGPGWLKGLLFLQLENALLYPGAALLEPRHAGMKSGQVPTLFSWKSWWGQVLRHVAFGIVLGLVYRPKK